MAFRLVFSAILLAVLAALAVFTGTVDLSSAVPAAPIVQSEPAPAQAPATQAPAAHPDSGLASMKIN